MLHKVNLPSCIPQLKRIVEFQRKVLRYACQRYYQLPLDEINIRWLFNGQGEWLWEKLWTQPKRKNGILPAKEKSELHKSLEKLAAYYMKNPQEGIVTLAAFDNDIQFADKLNDAGFRFQYPDLKRENQNLISPLMIAFYEDLLASGFIQAIHGVPERLNRDDFISSFWSNNTELNVCPACDRERSDEVDDKVYDDADHFLPKSKYPFLSLHPFNLFPLCIYCNRSFKGDRDMVDDNNNEPLLNIFHPYKRTALEKLNLQINRDQNGAPKLHSFTDIDSMPSRRMNSLNRVFRLNERWVKRLRTQKGAIIDLIIDERARLNRRGQIADINSGELRIILEEEKVSVIKKLGKNSGYIVRKSYLDFALSDNDEFQEIEKYFSI